MRKNTVEDFIGITKFPLVNYFNDIDYFFKNIYPSFVNFFSGQTKTFNQNNYKILNTLISKSNDISSLFAVYSNTFQTVDYWELLDLLEDIRTKLLTTKKIDKYLRSSITSGKTTLGIEYDYTLNSGQTLENIADVVLSSNNPDDDWIDIALRNDLKEVDWDIDGGKSLKLVDNSFQANLVTSMIDNTIGEKVYGKDIDRNITFENDDLKTLSYKESVYQAVDILSQLVKGDIPEFPTLAIAGATFKGTNFNIVDYPSLIREYQRLFNTDDLFMNFSVLDLSYDNGDITIDFEVSTKYNLVILKTATI